MILVLVRHGDAVDKALNAQRPLSEKGQWETEELCEKMSHIPLKIEKIFHSGILRSKETASIIQERLFKKAQLLEGEHLRPEDPVQFWLNNARDLEQPSMLVGHMPFVSILAHQLAQTPFFDFPTAGALALRRTDHAIWDVVWRSF